MSGKQRLSDKEILAIYEEYHKEGRTQGYLARKYQVSLTYIARIVHKETRQRAFRALGPSGAASPSASQGGERPGLSQEDFLAALEAAARKQGERKF